MKTFKTFLKESKIYSHNPDGSKKLNKIESINFKHSDLQKSKGYSNLVSISDNFHETYKKSNNYVSVTGKNDKLANKNIRELISKQIEMEYPEVEIDESGNINFVNGQYRFALEKFINSNVLVVMKDKCLVNAKKYGYVK
jgi:hypothetical protein